MNVIITKHAIEQYRMKMFATIDDAEITKILQHIVLKGKVDAMRPGNAYSMVYNGIKVVVTNDGNDRIVITCLGSRRYAAWAKKKEIQPRYRKVAM